MEERTITASETLDRAAGIMKSWWWVIAVMMMTLITYERSHILLSKEGNALVARLAKLKQEKQHEETRQRQLQMQIESQQDPQWVELTLMKKLGLTPDGYTKVILLRD